MREVHGAMTDSHSVSTGVSEEDEGGGQWVSVRLSAVTGEWERMEEENGREHT